MTASGSFAPVLAGIGDEAGPALTDQLTALATLGWHAIELRTVDGVAIADLDDRAFDAVAETLARRGIRTVCLDSRIGDWSSTITDDPCQDIAELHTLARRCPMLGARFVRIMSYPNGGLPDAEWERRVRLHVRDLADRAEQFGVVLLHENCAGWAGADAERALALVESVGSPALRLLMDTGNGIAYGYSAAGMLAELVELVAHVHVKDGRRTPNGPQWTLPGEGDAELTRCLELLAANGYRGALSIEPHLSLRPHEPDSDRGDAGGFVAAGRALERLLTAMDR